MQIAFTIFKYRRVAWCVRYFNVDMDKSGLFLRNPSCARVGHPLAWMIVSCLPAELEAVWKSWTFGEEKRQLNH